MRDISARELKGHNILAVERFQDSTRWMIEFSVQRPCSYGCPGDDMRLFLTEDGYYHYERKGMNMCTVQSIKDAIRESCQSQYDMESTDIDRVLQTLPFSEHEPMFSHPPKYKRPYRPWQNNKNS